MCRTLSTWSVQLRLLSIITPKSLIEFFLEITDPFKHTSINNSSRDLRLRHQLTVKQFADDTTVYASSPTPDELQVKLSSDLDCVAQWARCNQLELNTSKTQLLLM